MPPIFKFVAFISEVITYTKSYGNCGDKDGVSKKKEPTPPGFFWSYTVFAFEIWKKEKEKYIFEKRK